MPLLQAQRRRRGCDREAVSQAAVPPSPLLYVCLGWFYRVRIMGDSQGCAGKPAFLGKPRLTGSMRQPLPSRLASMAQQPAYKMPRYLSAGLLEERQTPRAHGETRVQSWRRDSSVMVSIRVSSRGCGTHAVPRGLILCAHLRFLVV